MSKKYPHHIDKSLINIDSIKSAKLHLDMAIQAWSCGFDEAEIKNSVVLAITELRKSNCGF